MGRRGSILYTIIIVASAKEAWLTWTRLEEKRKKRKITEGRKEEVEVAAKKGRVLTVVNGFSCSSVGARYQ